MRHDPEIETFLRSRAPGEVALVPPVVAEIEYGIRRLEAGTRKRVLLERELHRLLETIRVVAASHGADIVTANLTHFSRITALTSRHW